MKWKDVTLTVKGKGVLRGKDAKAWVEANLKGLVIDRGNDIVLLNVGGGTAYEEQAVRDALIRRSSGQVEDFTAGRVVVAPTPSKKHVRPSRTNPIKTTPPRLAMHLDVDRDGRIDDEPANYSTWVWGLRPEGRGAIMMAKLGDYAEGDVVLERAAIELRWTGPYVDEWTASLSVDKPEKIRVFASNERFDGHEEGATVVLEQRETGRSYQLDAPPDFDGITHSIAIDIDPSVAITGCEEMTGKVKGRRFADEETFRAQCRKEYLEPARTAYKRHQLAGFDSVVEDNKTELESLLDKKINYGMARRVLGKDKLKGPKSVTESITSTDVLRKTFTEFETLTSVLRESFEKAIQLPSEADFCTRFDELWERIAAAAVRPVYETKSSYELRPGVVAFDAIADGKEPRSTTLWIEAVGLPEVAEDSAWEVTLTFRFTPPKGRGKPTEQKAVLRIAPWLMSNDLDPTAEVYAKDMRPERLPMAVALQEFAALTDSAFASVYAQTKTEKGFLRDLIKSGYATAPHYRARVVLTGLDPRSRLQIEAPLEAGAGKDDVILLDRRVEDANAQSQDNGGNYMVSPPTKQHPFGRIIYGHLKPLVCNHAAFLDAQLVQSPIRIDAVWLSVGHADEMLTFLPDRGKSPNPAWPYKLLFGNSRLALLMLLEVATEADPLRADVATVIQRAEKNHEEHRYAAIDEEFINTHYPELRDVEPAAGFELPSSGTTSARAYFELHRKAFLQFAADIQPRIDKVRQQLIAELELDEADVLDVPVLFHGNVPVTADCVNMLVLNTEDATRCLVPKPFGPVVGDDYVFERYLNDRLTPLGVEFSFKDDWADFHVHEGEIHCGTNQLPQPLAAYRWWEMARPGTVQHGREGEAPPVIIPQQNPAVEVVGIQNIGNTCYLASTLQVLIHSTFVDTPAAIASAGLQAMVTGYRADATNGTYTHVDNTVRYTSAAVTALRDELFTAGLVARGREEDPSPVWEYLLAGLGEGIQLRVRKRYRLVNQVPRAATSDDVELLSSGWQSTPEVQTHRLVMIEPGTANTLSDALQASWNRTTGPMGTLNSAKVGTRVYQDVPQVEETTAWSVGATPRRFVMQLKRFDYDPRSGVANKITRDVTVGPQLTVQGRSFELRGVINHLGDSPTTGHYVAYVKARNSGNWYETNDSRVERRSEEYVLGKAKSSYLFYFERS